MTTLLLRLAGPMQAWGSSSRFSRRETEPQPTKSGVIGLLAAAMGRRRTDSIEDLLELRFGVRLDQRGQLMRDFHTARTLDGASSMPLSQRFYLADAAFLAGVEAHPALIEALDQSLRHPTFPLYLGRRSCPPAGPVTLGPRDADLVTALKNEPWRASPWWQRRHEQRTVELELVLDADEGHITQETYRDVPLSFDPRRRAYGMRSVIRATTTANNSFYDETSATAATPQKTAVADHDPFAALPGGD